MATVIDSVDGKVVSAIHDKPSTLNLHALPEQNGTQDDWQYPYPTDFKIHEHPIDDIRELKVSMTEYWRVDCQPHLCLLFSGRCNRCRSGWHYCWSTPPGQGARH
jgi:hypothetical protein